jgi:senataxin
MNLKSIFKDFMVLKNLKKIPLELYNILFWKKNLFKAFFKEKNFFLFSHFSLHFNLSQIRAISSTLGSKISLIQGPPGTGKTRTILGIIFLNFHKFISKKKNHPPRKKNLTLNSFFKNFNFREKKFNSFWNREKVPELTKNRKWKNLHYFGYNKQKTKRIIVCAFSNPATDENTARISHGLPLGKLSSKIENFQILRLGPNYKFFLDHLTLDSFSLIWGSENDQCISIWDSPKILKSNRLKILKKSKLIYTTLACASYNFLNKIKKKEILIIDEAAQAIELSTLAPIRNTCQRLILIGDIQQLPATIFSQSSLDFKFERCFFKRLKFKNFPFFF